MNDDSSSNLQRAVLLNTFQCLGLPFNVLRNGTAGFEISYPIDYLDAIRWIRSNNHGYIFDYLDCCEAAEICPSAGREKAEWFAALRDSIYSAFRSGEISDTYVKWPKPNKKGKPANRGLLYLGDLQDILLRPNSFLKRDRDD